MDMAPSLSRMELARWRRLNIFKVPKHLHLMKGKLVLITGATSGIGKATALALAKMGATIVFTSRDAQKGQATKDELIRLSGNPDIDFMTCDLASLESVRKFCSDFNTKHDSLNVLINNAGTWDFKRRVSKDGFENIFATNLLAPFLMSNLLLEPLKGGAPSRIITLSSGLHSGTINFDDIELKQGFTGMKAYRQSKLGVILFTRLLAKKLQGTGVTANCIHPGMVSTNLGRDSGAFMRGTFKLIGKKPEKGARTSIYLASSPEVEMVTGEYFANCKVASASKESHDMAAAERLWALAEKYTGL